jgi:hypothetical protein
MMLEDMKIGPLRFPHLDTVGVGLNKVCFHGVSLMSSAAAQRESGDGCVFAAKPAEIGNTP